MQLYLSVSWEKGNNKVLVSETPPCNNCDPRTTSVSYSPLYPIDEGVTLCSSGLLSGAYNSIHFFFSRSPFSSISEISKNKALIQKLYISVGLAQIVGFDLKKQELDLLAETLNCGAIEEWSITKDKSIKTDSKILIDFDDEIDPLELLPYSDLPHEFHFYLEEIEHSLSTLHRLSRLYFPEEIDTYKQLSIFINEAIERVRIINNAYNNSEDNNEGDLKHWNVYLSTIIEISASLSYVLVQGYSGRIPILQNPGPFPSHILLGIGGFIRSCTNITRIVENAFYENPIYKTLLKHYNSVENTSRCQSINYFNPTDRLHTWDDTDLPADRFENKPIKDKRPLLVHVSLRHGFKESKYNITSAAQSIVSCALPDWTLVTITHELMHSQVRGLIEALFTPPKSNKGGFEKAKSDFFIESIKNYETWHHEKKSNIPFAQILRNACFEFSLFNDLYVRAYYEKLSQGKDLKQYTSPIPSSGELTVDQFLALYRKHKTLLCELMVHALDFYYIYSSKEKPYCKSLWLSWSRIPAVSTDPDTYLIRFLAAIASKYQKSGKKAFEWALSFTLGEFEEMIASKSDTELINEIYHRANDENVVKALRMRFYPAYYITNITRKYLVSSKVREGLYKYIGDVNYTPSEDGKGYEIKIKEFSTSIKSDLGFILRQLVDAAENRTDASQIRELSAWISFVLNR